MPPEPDYAANRIFSLAGRTALVTGGSVSMGRAVALGLATAGADIAIQSAAQSDAAVGRPEASADTRAAITALGRTCITIEADFATAGEARRTVAEARVALGHIDILVIAASVQQRQALADITETEVHRQVAINFAATIELLQAALPPMAEKGWGRVLSFGSINETRPDHTLGIYAALKSAQHNLIINLAREYAGRGVLLNTLAPGFVATERNRWRRQDTADWERIQHRANPMHRAGRPEEMVGAALLLCSDAGSFITGANLQATGGAHL